MKLSIVVICWNDRKVILDCLRSIFAETKGLEFEVIVSDNGSSDGSLDCIRKDFPQVRIVENGANLGFAKGNNAGIRVATGQFVLILNPDTIIHPGALPKLVAYAERHPEGGAFGCRVLNPDGSYQDPAKPLPTLLGTFLAAVKLESLGRLFRACESGFYPGWDGRTERTIGFQSGCCVMFPGQMLRKLGGFDERFFYHYEETDLCCRVWETGSPVLYCPDAEITHLGGQSVGRFPIRFNLETYRGRYRYFYKHFGPSSLNRLRWIVLVHLSIRFVGYAVRGKLKPSDAITNRLAMYRVVLGWNWRLRPMEFIESGKEPPTAYEPLAPPPKMVESRA